MKMRILLLAVLVLALALPSVTGARDRHNDNDSSDGPWIHVEVVEDGEDGAKIKANLPLTLARVALGMAPEDVLHEGHIQLDEHDLSMDDLREAWKELRNAGDAEFVTVTEGDESVKVFRKGDRIFVHVDEGDEEMVRVEVPVALVDALLSGKGDELNLDAAMAALEDMRGDDIVVVQDGDDKVRVWID
jgi:hypothetical protein